MNDKNKDNFIDVEYKNINKNEDINNSQSKERIINGEPLFYNCSQVAQMVDVEPSTIRYWTKRFAHLLDIEISNKNKQYKKSDIEKLKFIKKLAKEDGLTLQQVDEYCTSKGFDMNNIKNGILDTTNPLAIQTFMAALTTEMDKKNENLLKQIDNRIELLDNKLKQYLILQSEENIKNNEELQQNLVTTVDEVISDKLEENSKEISDKLDKSTEKTIQLQQENQKQLNEVALTVDKIEKFNNEMNDRIRELLEDPKALNKLIKKEKNNENKRLNRIFNKIFNK